MQQRKTRSLDRLQFNGRKRGRAVEGTGLENRRRGNPFVSSNLTASAMRRFLTGSARMSLCILRSFFGNETSENGGYVACRIVRHKRLVDDRSYAYGAGSGCTSAEMARALA